MKEQDLVLMKQILKVQYHLPELDIIRNEVGQCFEISAFHACITLTNLLLERYCKLILIYKATSFKAIKNLAHIEKGFKDANKKYASLTLDKTLKQCKEQGVITEEAYNLFVRFKSQFRDGFSHADAAQILRGQTGNFAFGKFDGSAPLEIKNLVIQNVPPLHGIAVQLFAETNAFGYFVSVENLIRQTIKAYINDAFDVEVQVVKT